MKPPWDWPFNDVEHGWLAPVANGFLQVIAVGLAIHLLRWLWA